ncbi:MAG: DUF5362 family protein [Luteolibacter sp.]
MQNDPYAPPSANVHPGSNAGNSQISQAVLHQLAGTKPWVRFFSVIMFVGAGFMLLGAVGLLIAGSVLATSSSNPMFAGGMGFAIAGLYAVMSIVYIFPALKLWKYASHIGALLMTGSETDLVAALGQQRSFWKFVGILVLAMFALYFVAVIAMVVFGGFAAMNARH